MMKPPPPRTPGALASADKNTLCGGAGGWGLRLDIACSFGKGDTNGDVNSQELDDRARNRYAKE